MAVCKIVMTSNLLIAHSEHEFHGMFHISNIHCILYLFIPNMLVGALKTTWFSLNINKELG